MEVVGLLFVSNTGQTWKHFDNKKEVSKFEFSDDEFRVKNIKSKSILLEVKVSSNDEYIESSNTFCQFWYRNQIFGVYFIKVSDALKFKEFFKKAVEFAKGKEINISNPSLQPPIIIRDQNLSKISMSSTISIVDSTKVPTMCSNYPASDSKASQFELNDQLNLCTKSKKLTASFGANIISEKYRTEPESRENSNNISKSGTGLLNESVALDKGIDKNSLSVAPPRVPKRFESIKKVKTPRNESKLTSRDFLQVAVTPTPQNCYQSVPTSVQTLMEETKPKNVLLQARSDESLEMIDLLSRRTTNGEDENCRRSKIYFNNQENHQDIINNNNNNMDYNISSFTNQNPDPKFEQDIQKLSINRVQSNLQNSSTKPVSNQNQDKISEDQSSPIAENLRKTVSDGSIITQEDLDYLKMKILAYIHEEFEKLSLRLSRK